MEEILPYFLVELIEDMGGIAEVDASRVQQRIKSGESKKITFEIINDKLRVEILDED